jgi:hypothetical protein
LGEKLNVIKAETLLVDSKDVGLEVNAKKTTDSGKMHDENSTGKCIISYPVYGLQKKKKKKKKQNHKRPWRPIGL